ncbi:hypothetical protein BGP_4275 [Beggiatoa sp. PS]|nr:hypothetical protein BGP_4275 [Beggiatoa sp. PS]
MPIPTVLVYRSVMLHRQIPISLYAKPFCAANNNTGVTDTIKFGITGTGTHTITLATEPLPVITDPIIIDGYTQTGTSENTQSSGSNAVLKIVLDGNQGTITGTLANGLKITAGDSTVKGLVINNFERYGILLMDNGGNKIIGNYIGTDADGTTVTQGNSSHGYV